ncbi:MAG: hypothetical protein H0Z37_08675 [Firmicutes bacterium]|nr:hypothetical protein [Bacillota bacterium]
MENGPTVSERSLESKRWAEALLQAVRTESRRRRRRPALRRQVWHLFYSWVHDPLVEAVIVAPDGRVHLLREGSWQTLASPFRQAGQVRELVRRLTLLPRRNGVPVHARLPEGFELFAWEAAPSGGATVLLHRIGSGRQASARLEPLLGYDRQAVDFLTRRLARRQHVLVCGPSHHARETVLAALAETAAGDGKLVCLIHPGRGLPVLRAAASIAVDFGRIIREPQLARVVLDQVSALSPDWIVSQEAPEPLLEAVAGWPDPSPGFMAAGFFPLRRFHDEGRRARAGDRLPPSVRLIVEVGGFRRPQVEGIWQALPGKGAVRAWRRASPWTPGLVALTDETPGDDRTGG